MCHRVSQAPAGPKASCLPLCLPQRNASTPAAPVPPACPTPQPASSTFRKIIDDKGDDLGFVAFVEELTKMVMEMGGSVVFHAKVTKVDRMPGMTQQYALTIEGPGGEVRTR